MSTRALPLLALLLSAGIFFAYVKPTWQGPIAATKSSIAASDAALKAAADYKARENQLARERSAIPPENLARLSTFLPDSVDNVRIILDLNALAARSGLNLTSINVASSNAESASGSSARTTTVATTPSATPGMPGSTGAAGGGGSLPTSNQQNNPVGSVDLSLTVAGSYDDFQNFLAAVEKSARLLDVQELSVEGSDTGVYTYDLSVRLYWLR